MTPSEYKALRQKLGTQQQVADLLGVHRVTIADREAGRKPISREADYALTWVASRSERYNKNVITGRPVRKRPA
jgi:DNA-binding transcriptional regulator YiaG